MPDKINKKMTMKNSTSINLKMSAEAMVSIRRCRGNVPIAA